MTEFEQKCAWQIQKSLEENIKLQLETHFQKVVESCQKDISQLSSPLFKRAEKGVQSLTDTVIKANAFCENIQAQYALRWSSPFFFLVGTAGLAEALMGIFLSLSQAPFISVLFINPHLREAYITGRDAIEARKKLEAQAAETLVSQAIPKEQEIQKASTPLKQNPTQKQ